MTRSILLPLALLAACASTQQDENQNNNNNNGGAAAQEARTPSAKYSTAEFKVYEDDGRLWVFRADGKGLQSFLEKGEPAKRVTMVGAGPDGKTVMGSEKETLETFCAPYRYGLHGYVVLADDGRLWVFRRGSKAYGDFQKKGEPAKRVTLVGSGPDGVTIMGADEEVVRNYRDSWKYASPGFAVYGDDGRLWVFKNGSESHAAFLKKGEPAKRVTLIGAGPDGMTIMGAEKETLDAYSFPFLYGQAGYIVIPAEGRLWIFREGSDSYAKFVAKGEPAKRVTLVGAGPRGMTVMGAEKETLEAYCAEKKFGRPGFVVVPDDGRLWVFRVGSDSYAKFVAKGEPAKRVTLVGSGPEGKTLMGAEKETLEAYRAHFPQP